MPTENRELELRERIMRIEELLRQGFGKMEKRFDELLGDANRRPDGFQSGHPGDPGHPGFSGQQGPPGQNGPNGAPGFSVSQSDSRR